MMNTSLALLTTHFIGDFLLQSNYMALGKSKEWKPLLLHTSVYSVCFLPWGWKFAIITFLLHTLVDYFTSRCTSKLWFIELWPNEHRTSQFLANVHGDKRHWFFVMIGFDQLIHAFCLSFTVYLVG